VAYGERGVGGYGGKVANSGCGPIVWNGGYRGGYAKGACGPAYYGGYGGYGRGYFGSCGKYPRANYGSCGYWPGYYRGCGVYSPYYYGGCGPYYYGGVCAPAWYGGYAALGGFVGGYGYSTVYQPAVDVVQQEVEVVEQPAPPPPPAQIVQWDDSDLTELALNKFAFTRGLDRDGNKVIVEIVSKDYHDEAGALAKVKFKVRWVEWKAAKGDDGQPMEEEKREKTTIKLKFDDFGRFTEYDD
jgi:hypothetical protein